MLLAYNAFWLFEVLWPVAGAAPLTLVVRQADHGASVWPARNRRLDWVILMLPGDFFAGLAIVSLFAVPLGAVLIWAARKSWRETHPTGDDNWETQQPSTTVSVRGDTTERLVAAFVSPIIAIVCAGLHHAGHFLFDSGPLFVEIVYYELIYGLLGLALLGFVWGVLRPRWLKAIVVAAASHVASTVFLVATVGVVIALIGLAFHAAARLP